jgi:hypothetical protein
MDNRLCGDACGDLHRRSGHEGKPLRGHHDVFRAHRVWVCATILTVGYMISRGLAKSGSRDRYTAED